MAQRKASAAKSPKRNSSTAKDPKQVLYKISKGHAVPGFCSTPPEPVRTFGPSVHPGRAAAIISRQRKWTNGTKLHFYFFDRDTDGEKQFFTDGTSQFVSWVGSKSQQNVVRKAFKIWKDIDIGLEFEEVTNRNDAEIRIGFMPGDGAWSFIGRRILNEGPNRRTMNFGWRLSGISGRDTAIHEIGHTLGLPHEHQNPKAGIVWDEAAVIADLGGPPNNWSESTTRFNIINKIDPDTVQGSSWDPDSIMHYPFKKGLILQPVKYKTQALIPAPGLSPRDISWVVSFYPPLEPAMPQLMPFQSMPLELKAKEQLNAEFTPTVTRNYTIETFGQTDMVLVLFEDVDGDLQYRSGDDDSGEDWNAKIEFKMIKGRRYVIRARLYWSFDDGASAIMVY